MNNLKPDTDVSSTGLPGLSGEIVAFGGKSSSFKTFTEIYLEAFPSVCGKANLNCSAASFLMSGVIKDVKAEAYSCLRNNGCA